MDEDGQVRWLHFSVLVHADSPITAAEIADVIRGEVGAQPVCELAIDGFGRLVRGSKPIRPRGDDDAHRGAAQGRNLRRSRLRT